MILKKLTEILKTYGNEELKKFGKFIRSDYFNTNERITILFKTLKKFYPAFDDPKLKNEYLFRQIYGSRKYEDKTFRYLLAELLELAEKFISFSPAEKNTLELNKSIIENLITRMLFSHANSILKQSDRKLEKEFILSSEYIQNKIDYSHLWHHLIFYANLREHHDEKRIELAEYTAIFTMIELCHQYQDFYSNRINFNVEPEDNILFGFVENVNFRGMMDYTEKLELNSKMSNNRKKLLGAFKIYLCFMITFTEETDEEYFTKMRTLIEEYGKYFEREEQQNLHVMLTSCCNIKIRTVDNDKYQKIHFEVLQSALSKELLTAYEGQHMHVEAFYRIFHTAMDLKEYTWAETFAANYVSRLSPHFADDMNNYTAAVLFFQAQKFEDSLKALSKIGYRFSRLKLSVRALMLMIFYEIGYIEEAYSLIDSFLHFLNENNKINPKQRKQYFTLTNYIKALLKHKTGSGESKILSELRKEVIGYDLLQYKSWLINKTDELTEKIK